MAQIGDLGVKLTADVKQFQDKLKDAEKSVTGLRDKATQGFEEIGNQVSRINQPLGGLISSLGSFKTAGPAAFLAVGAAAGALAANVVTTAAEIANLARVAGTSPEDFQRMAAAAQTVGIEQDKLSDQLKDFNEKMGEFFQSGAGPMKDFFDIIAPKIGITAEAFRNLSGPQALQLYYNSLQKAGLSQQEMSWYLETMGSDLTQLMPLLQNNGKAMSELGDKAERTGKVLSDDVVKGAQELNQHFNTMKGEVVGLANTIGSALIPSLVRLARAYAVARGAGSGVIGAIGAGIYSLTDGDDISLKGQAELAAKRMVEAQERVTNYTRIEGADGYNVKKYKEELRQLTREYEQLSQMASVFAATTYKADTSQTGSATAPPKDGKGKKGSKSSKGSGYAIDPDLESTLEDWNFFYSESGLQKNVENLEARVRAVNAALAASPTAVLERQRQLMADLAAAFESGKITADQFSEAASTALGNIPNDIDKLENKLISVQTVANDAANMMTRSFIDFATSSDKSFSDFARNFLANIAEMIVQAMILNAVKTAGGAMAGAGGFIGTIGTALIGSANGNAFENGRPIQQFANGGIISQPVRFPLAGGRTGEAGEAGIEGIFPLIRKNGKLGVHAVGAGTTNNQVINQVTVTVQGGNQDPDQLGQKVADQVVRALVRSEVANQMRSGGLLSR